MLLEQEKSLGEKGVEPRGIQKNRQKCHGEELEINLMEKIYHKCEENFKYETETVNFCSGDIFDSIEDYKLHKDFVGTYNELLYLLDDCKKQNVNEVNSNINYCNAVRDSSQEISNDSVSSDDLTISDDSVSCDISNHQNFDGSASIADVNRSTEAIEDKSDHCEGDFNDMQETNTKSDKVINKLFECDECPKAYSRKTYLYCHKQRKHSNYCKFCKQHFSDQRDFEKHNIAHIKKYDCDICNESFKREHALIFHIKTEHVAKTTYTCEICDKKFSDMARLKKHMLVHTEERPYMCDVCLKDFTRYSDLKIHSLLHTGKKRHTCKECGKKFLRKNDLKQHDLTHAGEKEFKCNTCGKHFIRKAALLEHLITHTGERNYICNICNEHFSRKSAYNDHLKIHTTEKIKNLHVCEVCKKSFIRKRDLTRHSYTHTNYKPHECAECGQKFAQKTNLKTHMLIHTNKREFICDICDKRFSQKKNLKKHYVMHTGEKAYVCYICQGSFSRSDTLKRHQRKFHSKPVFKISRKKKPVAVDKAE